MSSATSQNGTKKSLPDDVQLPSNKSAVTVCRTITNPCFIFKTRRLVARTGSMMLLWLSTAMQLYGLQFAANELGGTIYTDFMVLSAAGIPGIIAAAIGMKVMGRKPATLIPVVLGAFTCFVIAALPHVEKYDVGRLVLGMMGTFCGNVQFSCLHVWSAEMFPTSMRAGAMGLFQMSSRLGSGLSPIVAIELARLGEELYSSEFFLWWPHPLD